MPRPIIYAALILTILAMIPPALIAYARAVPSSKTRIHLIQDMDNQGRFEAQHPNPMFADGRAMRPPVPGTVARGELKDDERFERGVVRDQAGKPQWLDAFPSQIEIDDDTMKRGQERFTIYCRPCHGDAGYGDGIIHKRADELVRIGANGTTWVQPKSLHEAAIRVQPSGQIFNTITHGIRTMAGYEAQIPTEDRWAIVLYVKALQRSQHAKPEDVPPGDRADLKTIRFPKPAMEANP